MKEFEKQMILDEIEVLKDYVNTFNETKNEKATRFNELIERLKEEAEGFRSVRHHNEKDAEKMQSLECKYYHIGKAAAYSLAVKSILQVIEDFNGKDM